MRIRPTKTALLLSLSLSLSACHPALDVEHGAERSAQEDPETSSQRPGHSGDTPSVPAKRATQEATPTEQYMCKGSPTDCRLNSDPFVAGSENEARWLSLHGYPSRAAFEQLRLLSLDQLKAEANAGNGAAGVMYGKKLAMQPGRFYAGATLLHEEAVSGNLYAYYGLSELYWDHEENKSLVESAAFLRVAYLLGDWKASEQIARLRLSEPELLEADRRAASLLNTFSGDVQPSRRPLE